MRARKTLAAAAAGAALAGSAVFAATASAETTPAPPAETRVASTEVIDDPGLPAAELAKIQAVLATPVENVVPPTDMVSTAAVGQKMQNMNSKKCVEVPGWSKSSGTRLDQWSCLNQANERWKLRMVGSVPAPGGGPIFQIYNDHSGMCMTVNGKQNGRAVVQRPCGPRNTWTQTWWFYGRTYGTYANYGYSAKCLDVPGAGTGNGVKMDIWDCGKHTKRNQLFRLIS